MKNITPEELEEKLNDEDKDEILIDVRSLNEYEDEHIEEARNIPLNDIEEAANRLKNVGTVYVTCGTGVRSQQACKDLAARGVNVVNVKGGIQAWEKEGLEMVGEGGNHIPIIRQVMITAGSLILVGNSLALTLDIRWVTLSLIVGAGLLFAGVSGICLMSKVLDKMPWNK